MSVTFIYGGNSKSVPSAVKRKAKDVLPVLRSSMGVPSGANAEIGDILVTEEYEFKDGDQVVFYKASGEKGL